MAKKVAMKDTEKDNKKEGNKKVEKRIDFKTWISVGILAIALVFVIALIMNFSQNEKYDSSYFHDSDGKIVFTMDKDMAVLDESIYEPNITHIVYYYSGNNVTNVKAFYEYATEREAEISFEHLGLGTFADSKNLNGRFIVFQVKKSMYENLTVDTLKTDAEKLKSADALILDYEDGYINKFAELTFEEDSEE